MSSAPHFNASPQWRDGRFRNRLARQDGPLPEMLGKFFFGGAAHRKPEKPVPTERRTAADFAVLPTTGLRVTWLGHSTVLLEIDGVTVLIDPVWSERASPVAFAGPRRFFAPPLPLAELPAVDAIVLSHDHYDHLDERFVRAAARSASRLASARWIVPLGVGAHLQRWGIDAAKITECDWWQSTQLGDVELTATPARHFSGRGIGNRDSTLWSGWAFTSASHRVYYAGDTAMQHEFEEIGRRLGPFDLTMIEIGAYDRLWPDVHIGPEQALAAHRLVGGGTLLPLHWGTFDLALHAWTEPIERLLAAVASSDGHGESHGEAHGESHSATRVLTPRPGEMVEPASTLRTARWWPDVPWQTAADAPIVSTGFEIALSSGAR